VAAGFFFVVRFVVRFLEASAVIRREQVPVDVTGDVTAPVLTVERHGRARV
jgi:hypothetical protein